MANLGSDNTPVKGENFSLPAGAQIDEDGDDLVVRDSGGSIVLRRDEGAGAWDFVSEDVAGIASLNAGDVFAGKLSPNNLDEPLEIGESGEIAWVENDSALAKANGTYSIILLSNGQYADDYVFDERTIIKGQGALPGEGSSPILEGELTFNDRGGLLNLVLGEIADVTVNDRFHMSGVSGWLDTDPTVTITGDGDDLVLINGIMRGGELILESGTTNVVVDSVQGWDVVDNGDNTVGTMG